MLKDSILLTLIKQNDPDLKELNLSNKSLTEEDIEALIVALKNNSYITNISLDGNNIKENVIGEIKAKLPHSWINWFFTTNSPQTSRDDLICITDWKSNDNISDEIITDDLLTFIREIPPNMLSVINSEGKVITIPSDCVMDINPQIARKIRQDRHDLMKEAKKQLQLKIIEQKNAVEKELTFKVASFDSLKNDFSNQIINLKNDSLKSDEAKDKALNEIKDNFIKELIKITNSDEYKKELSLLSNKIENKIKQRDREINSEIKKIDEGLTRVQKRTKPIISEYNTRKSILLEQQALQTPESVHLFYNLVERTLEANLISTFILSSGLVQRSDNTGDLVVKFLAAVSSGGMMAISIPMPVVIFLSALTGVSVEKLGSKIIDYFTDKKVERVMSYFNNSDDARQFSEYIARRLAQLFKPALVALENDTNNDKLEDKVKNIIKKVSSCIYDYLSSNAITDNTTLEAIFNEIVTQYHNGKFGFDKTDLLLEIPDTTYSSMSRHGFFSPAKTEFHSILQRLKDLETVYQQSELENQQLKSRIDALESKNNHKKPHSPKMISA